MILRVFRGSVALAEAEAFRAFVRDQAVASALQVPGLLSMQPGMRATAGGHDFALVSTWTGFDAIFATGAPLDSPVALPGSARFVTRGNTDYYELMGTEARGIPVAGTTLRITRVPLQRGFEAVYFEKARAIVEQLLDEAGLLAYLLGRRVVGGTTEAITVSLWEEGRLEAMAGTDLASSVRQEALRTYHAAPPSSERYDGLALTSPRADAPAIMLADDERRYLHATPAVARLTGHSIARLLTLRIDDLTDPELRPSVPEAWARFMAQGSMDAAYSLRRADGSTVAVRFSARARAPWPGCHASMFVPADDPSQPDIDEGLVRAGFISRFMAPA